VNNTTAQCTTTDKVVFKGKSRASPYSCDPTDNEEKCQLFFNITGNINGTIAS
jgi:hypothetical protein